MHPTKRTSASRMRQLAPTSELDGRLKRNYTQQTSRSVIGFPSHLISHTHAFVFDVQRTQLHNECTVERIVRERSANGMNPASVAPFFRHPPHIVCKPCKHGASISSRRATTLKPSGYGPRRKDDSIDYVIPRLLFLLPLPSKTSPRRIHALRIFKSTDIITLHLNNADSPTRIRIAGGICRK